MAISDRSSIIVSADQVSCDLSGEAAILNFKDGVYYTLNPVGARVWSLLQGPMTLPKLVSAIVHEYDVDPDRASVDIQSLLHDLEARGLIEISDAVA